MSAVKHTGTSLPSAHELTRALLGLWIFHHLQEGGGVFEHPTPLSQPVLVVEKKEKNIRKLIKNDYETTSVIFSLRSILRSLEVIIGQISVFSDIAGQIPL